MKKIYALLLCIAGITANAQQIDDITLINAVDGKPISIKNYASTGVIVIFMVNDCPFDEYYAARINNLANGRLPLLLVNAHPEQAATPEAMTKCLKDRGIKAPYLADKDQVLMQKLGTHKSTEAFLLKKNGEKLTVYYRGAIDDNPQVAADVKHPYLQDAIDKFLAGQNSNGADARPVGCNIRKK